jgi:hypothetical protein
MDEFNSDHDTDGLEEEEYDEHDDYSSNHHDQQEDDDNKPTARHLIKQACSVSHAAYASTLVKIPTTITLIPPPPPTATTTNPHPLPPTSTPEHKSLSYPLDDM